jgi:hypothetical protein
MRQQPYFNRTALYRLHDVVWLTGWGLVYSDTRARATRTGVDTAGADAGRPLTRQDEKPCPEHRRGRHGADHTRSIATLSADAHGARPCNREPIRHCCYIAPLTAVPRVLFCWLRLFVLRRGRNTVPGNIGPTGVSRIDFKIRRFVVLVAKKVGTASALRGPGMVRGC